MKTIYKCECCGSTSERMDDTIACEGMCKLANDLNEIFGSDEWSPPPLKQFKLWNTGDRKEIARRIDSFYTKHYR